jgi:hypothetical protein
MKFIAWLLLIGAAAGLAGCSSMAVKTLPNTDLRQYKRVFVEHRLPDGRNLDQLIARDLRALGYDASAGAATMMPRDTQLVVEYVDTWDWQFKTYMISFDLQVRDERTDRTLATVHRFRPAEVLSSTPDAMIRGVVQAVFKPI